MSSFDVTAVNFKNYDPLAYNDTTALAKEKNELGMLAIKEHAADVHPADLLSHEIRMFLEQENRRGFVPLDDSLSVQENLWRHYKIVQSYEHSFEEFIDKITEYRKEEKQEVNFMLRVDQVASIHKSMDRIANRSRGFVDQFERVQYTIDEALAAQFAEYKSAIDHSLDVGLHAKLPQGIEDVNLALNSLMDSVEATLEEA